MTSVRLPDGTYVRALSIRDRSASTKDRDIGLYLDPAWKPDWPAIVIDWPDYGLPSSSTIARDHILDIYHWAKSGGQVEVGCFGGLGRTGTVLACFCVLCGLEPEDAIEWVRSGYDRRAIETDAQEAWVTWFAEHLEGQEDSH